MIQTPDILSFAQNLASHAESRQTVIARNIANADTPGFKAKDLKPFIESYSENSNFAIRSTRAGHFTGTQNAAGYPIQATNTGTEAAPNGNSVSLEQQMTKAVEVKHQFDMALGIYRKSMDILRISLGK